VTKAQAAERTQAIEELRERMPVGSIAYTIVRHVSRTGNASISVYRPEDIDATPGSRTSYLVARALGFRMDPENGGVKVGYMGERRDSALVHDLARTLHGSSTALRHAEL